MTNQPCYPGPSKMEMILESKLSVPCSDETVLSSCCRRGCPISDGDSVINTGGSVHTARMQYYVTRFYINGTQVRMPSMNRPRTRHGCARYINKLGETVSHFSYI